VVFDLRKGSRDEQVEARPAIDLNSAESYELTPGQQAIVRYLEGDLPVTADFYGQLANHLGLEKSVLLQTLTLWKGSGVLRRIGLLLRHREVGFLANGMCCWNVPQADILEVGRRVSQCPEVTHCYERPLLEIFPFNLFAMIHTTAWQDTQSLFQRISDDCGLSGGQLLLSVREYKKTSMQFF
jgi:DNA-binding Lrp family transcriptional regulator